MSNRSTPVVDARTEAILDAAEAHFAAHGFDATKLASIAKDAGVAVGTIYLRYSSKEDLLGGILERVAVRFRNSMDRPDIRAVPFPARFASILEAIFQTAAEQKHLARLMPLASFAPTGDRQRLDHILAAIEDHLRDGIARSELRADVDVRLAAHLAYGMVERAMLVLMQAPNMDAGAVIAQITDNWTRWLATADVPCASLQKADA